MPPVDDLEPSQMQRASNDPSLILRTTSGMSAQTVLSALERKLDVDEAPQNTSYAKTYPSSYIFRLPNELVCYVFRILFDVYFHMVDSLCDQNLRRVMYGMPLPANPEELRPPWVIVLQVCHLWRSIALRYARLWTRVPTTNLRWMEHFLSVSSRLPLEFNLEIDGSDSGLDIAKLVGQQAVGRVHELLVHAPPDVQTAYVNQFLDDFVRTGAPLLRSLSLHVLEQHVPAQDGAGQQTLLALTDQSFLQRLSHLNFLSVHCLSGSLVVQMDHPAFRSLTGLTIASKHAWQRYSTAEFMSCLQTWTQLRVLYLEHGLPTDVTGIFPIKSSTPVILPSLRVLELLDEVHFISNFMSHFAPSIPGCWVKLIPITMDRHFTSTQNDFRRAVMVNLMSQVSELAIEHMEELEFSCVESHNTSISTRPSKGFGDLRVHTACLQTVFDEFQLSQVRKLTIDAMEEFFAIDWSRGFAKMHKLRKVRVYGENFGPLVEALGTTLPEQRDGQTGETQGRKLCCPKLRYLELSPRWMEGSTLDSVVRGLKNRMDWGSPLPLLHVRMDLYEPLDAEYEKALSEVVCSLKHEVANLDGHSENEREELPEKTNEDQQQHGDEDEDGSGDSIDESESESEDTTDGLGDDDGAIEG